jgi:hypothetical protein
MNRLDRRDFLRQGAAAALTAGAFDALAAPAAPRVQQYRRLGRTGLSMSTIT